MPKSKRQLADEAYRRVMETPLPEGTLRGQLDGITGEMAGVARKPEPMEVGGIPHACLSCGRQQTMQAGWTVLPVGEGEVTKIQCGKCCAVYVVPADAWARLRDQLRAWFAASDRPPVVPHKHRRERGAR